MIVSSFVHALVKIFLLWLNNMYLATYFSETSIFFYLNAVYISISFFTFYVFIEEGTHESYRTVFEILRF